MTTQGDGGKERRWERERESGVEGGGMEVGR